VWGGNSFQTEIVGNDFRGQPYRHRHRAQPGQCHRQQPLRSRLDAIRLWEIRSSPPTGAIQSITTRGSRCYRIGGNEFAGKSDDAAPAKHRWAWIRSRLLVAFAAAFSRRVSPPFPPFARSAIAPAIIVDEWGPYNWESPKLWPVDSTRAVPMRLVTLGPSGQWRLVSLRGIATLSRASRANRRYDRRRPAS